MTNRSATALLCLLAIAATSATAAPGKRSSIESKEHSKEHAKGERIVARLRENPKLLRAYVANLKATRDGYQKDRR